MPGVKFQTRNMRPTASRQKDGGLATNGTLAD